MKKKILIAIIATVFLSFGCIASAALSGKEAHERYIYPSVRVTVGYGGGSGTVVYSKEADGKYSTFVLTNHHVIAGAISVVDEWNTDLQKKIKKEKRSVVYVETFKYRNLSTPVGTMKVEADIVIYDKDGDMALLKLRMDDRVEYVAKLPAKADAENINVMDESIAVGCSLGFPTIPSVGVISRLNLQVNSLPFHMSSAQIIFGNSGGSMYKTDGTFIGIPSMVAVAWRSAVTHMGLFIPVKRIYEWLEKQHYDFIYDSSKNEKESLELRKKELKKKKAKSNNN